MPTRQTATTPEAHQVLKNTSFERIAVSWLMQDGWQVFLPILDHGHQTDILISDGPNYYRIQVKTVAASGEEHTVKNQWADSNVDWVIFFARNSNWGVITPAFSEDTRPLNHPEHFKFDQNKNDFLRAFHKAE